LGNLSEACGVNDEQSQDKIIHKVAEIVASKDCAIRRCLRRQWNTHASPTVDFGERFEREFNCASERDGPVAGDREE
jgi:hypothetical protein